MADMIKFYKGLEASLPEVGTNGALYITTDEGAIYLGTGTGMKRLGDFIQVANVAALPAKAHESCLYYCVAENILAKWNGTEWKQINKQPTAEELKTLLGLGSMAYKSEVAEGDLNTDLAAKINAASGAQHGHDNKDVIDGITADKVTAWDNAEKNAKDHADGLNTAMNTRVEALEAIDHEHTNKALLDTYTQTEANLADAVAKKHAHTFNETELNKIAEGDVAKWNGVAADHLTADDKTALENSIKEAKKAGTDANTNIEAYKVTNDARVLAVEEDIADITNADNGILAQAKTYTDGKDSAMNTRVTALETAAPTHALKTEVEAVDAKFADYNTTVAQKAIDDAQDAEIAKKVAKTDYEADKATFATKTELNDVDAKFASYKTAADQKLIDDAQDVEIGKKVDKVEGKDLIATSEIARLLTLENYDDTQVKADIAKKADAETMTTELGKKVDKVEGYSLISDDEIVRLADVDNYDDTEVRGLIGGNADAIEALEDKIGEVPEDKTITQMIADAKAEATYDDTELAGRVKAIEDDYLVEADIANFETKENVKKVADDLAAYVEANDEALAGVKATAEAARTEDEVNSQIDTKITALNLGTTYEPIGAETRAKAYADGLITDANLDQYTTEQEVKDIVDGVIASAADSETYNSLTKLVDYIDTHGGEAAEMAQAIDTLEGKVETIEGKPAYGITATQISNWDGEVGAKALAETKLDASTFTAYETAHANDYTNKQIDDAIDADVKTAIDAEVERADGKYEEKGVAQGIVDALKLAETYEPIGAEERAITEAGKLDAALKTELQKEIDDDVKVVSDALAEYKTSNDEAVATKANSADVYAKTETYTQAEVDAAIAAAVEAAHTWGEF